MDLVPIDHAGDRLCAELSRLLRRDRRLREAMGMDLAQAPRTARQAKAWARAWCKPRAAQFFVLAVDARAVGGLTLHPDRAHWYVGSAFTAAHVPMVGKDAFTTKTPRHQDD